MAVWLAPALALLIGAPAARAQLQEGAIPPHWIWAPGTKPGEMPAGTRYFRKAFQTKEPRSTLVVDVAADNSYVLYLDGKEIARGDDWHTVQQAEAKLEAGPHVLAAAATNEAPGPAGLLLRGGVLPLGQAVPVHTDATWKAADAAEGDAWTKVDFDDSAWKRAQDLGVLGTPPWTGLVFESTGGVDRFKVPAGFAVRMVGAPKVTGSVVAFTFDPQGRPVVSVERGPIALLLDEDKDGTYEDRRVLNEKMSNCQGLAFIKGHLFAVGDGPKGTGLYRLDDGDGDGSFEQIELVRNTDGGMGEHGPHAVQLGPDGSLYFNSGNHAHLRGPIEPGSPYSITYEGELLPHYNDANGHAAGIMAPGGEIDRSDDGGRTWQRVVAGFRNEYDFAFNRAGELFSFDSDMEWDIGLPWYRPVRVVHGVPGAEFGWRNGSGKWPPYYVDSLPAALDVGRGSPTGVTFYQGHKFPKDYDDNFLICDWSQGRILAVALARMGATYRGRAKELVTGQPLNCTDVEVGPDGAVYFTTGGRGTLGGLFRVSHVETDKPDLIEPKGGEPDLLGDALGMDSPLSAFSQRRLDQIKAAMGDDWGPKLAGVARDANRPAADRIRALDLLVQFGPKPEESLLAGLADDPKPEVRAKAVQCLGLLRGDAARKAAMGALKDRDEVVRRRACEALVRQGGAPPMADLIPLLSDDDAWVRYAARIAIEHGDVAAAQGAILAGRGGRAQIDGMLAIVRAVKLDAAAQDGLLGRQFQMLRMPIAPEEYADLLRLIGLTYLRGPRKPAECATTPQLREALLTSFTRSGLAEAKAGKSRYHYPTMLPVRRELARLLAFLGEPKAVAPILLAQSLPDADRPTQIHYANCLRAIKEGWTDTSRRQLWGWYEQASRWEGGFSFRGYLDFMAQELVALLTPAERTAFLAEGEKYPFPTRVLVRSLDPATPPKTAPDLSALYARLDRAENKAAANELRAAIIDRLGSRPGAHPALRELARRDPARRDLIARALAANPTPDDLPLLVEALDGRDRNTTNILLSGLAKIDRAPEGPEGLRNLIRAAQRTGPQVLPTLNALAARWAGTKAPEGDFAAALRAWEAVYAERFPRGPALYEASSPGQVEYTLSQLFSDVISSGLVKKASPDRGRLVIAKAKCLDCHKFGDQGQGLGPDLTTVSSRFRTAEVLESIVEPSKVISDQYRPITVATADGKVFNGMPTAGEPDKLALLLSDGTRVSIPKADVEEQKESKVSVMPEGLLNALSLQEIADLLALFEAQPKVSAPEGAADKK